MNPFDTTARARNGLRRVAAENLKRVLLSGGATALALGLIGCSATGAPSPTNISCSAKPNPDGSIHVSVIARNDGDGGDMFVKPIVIINGGERKDNGDAMRHLEHGETASFGKNVPIPPGSYATSCDAGI